MAVLITRPDSVRFVMIRNEWARDPRISSKALGLLTYLHSHEDGYRLSQAQIVRARTDGKDAVASGLAELEAAGYLRRWRDRAGGGRWGEIDYALADPFDSAGRLRTDAGNPHPLSVTHAGNPTSAGNPPPLSVEDADNPPMRETRITHAQSMRETRQSGLSAAADPQRETRPLEDKRENTTNTLPLPLPPEEANGNGRRQEPAETFEEFWAAYPKKVGKDAARRAWAKAARRADAAKIIDVVRRYPFRDDRQFVKDPATWLNAGCWEDDLDDVAAARDSSARSGRPRPEPYRNPPPGSYTTGDGKL